MIRRWSLAALLLVSSCGNPPQQVWRNDALCHEGDPMLLGRSDGSKLGDARAEVARLEREARRFDVVLGEMGALVQPGSKLEEAENDARARVREHAFKLAPGPDDADVIARAVAYICTTQATKYAFEVVHLLPKERGDQRVPLRKWHDIETEIMTKDALVDVLRARAGHCDAPARSR